MASKRVIVLAGYPVVHEFDEAAEAITPGHLVGYDGSGNLVKHASAGDAIKSMALERDEMGDDIDVAYATGDTVKVGTFHAGLRALGWVPSGANLAKGAVLESDGAGRFRALSAGTPIARAFEALDNSAGPGDARLKVEWL